MHQLAAELGVTRTTITAARDRMGHSWRKIGSGGEAQGPTAEEVVALIDHFLVEDLSPRLGAKSGTLLRLRKKYGGLCAEAN